MPCENLLQRPACTGDAEARLNFGVTLATLRRFDEATAQLSEAVRRKPDLAEARQVLEDVENLKRASGK